ncbi:MULTISPECIES: UDP-N-acetylglucosamine 2-epimerase [unclassified Candidatus Frackibacter]|uniref:UDP-N-acetylglucosamine 2-epimerase n=1 Tax=unclassified Candidatus Frackibacter TaxID=2648818 RepID=UPI000799BC65|nr:MULTISPECIES: UDP-N-acetylglucosamine 2-epimerase [unclassified Candidatus Frackibacter]KXS40470.1 MAG: UDP-N-acetyl-D-glucosamine 2-epimerase, UDP-hydrolysing [Candidatus Frackibacter sp. T328-2]SDC72788.1 GDP/UDP-N,N'-diacetylbacillosamine 2-epimerase (hydrolysing) [Candidatus Frackibacter sp. WG11]SEM87054.1 GDP/UDP-N,N'-diacetylbacillosamine 2-epimerase (hydrolysing) [Candidatus Frackibacter sp. WG12]SFL96098.1 GDP/UDP-N,N'-diacetylbacillosamine 2-epimerase (hydrolysing) [Candidatus Frac
MDKRKICVVTGTRAEYGLLYWLMKEIDSDPNLELQIITTGMHLSPEFGLTYKKIEEDGFKIDKKVEMLMSSDTEVGITKSVGLGCIGFADAYDELKPDIVVVLGDRFEVLAAAIAAMIAKIPIAHLHGGEITEGAIDESIRHSLTKMASTHFPATKEYARRVIQMGEKPRRVFNFGAPGLDNIHKLDLLSRTELENELNFQLASKTAIVTYHSVTLENNTAHNQIENLLKAIEKFEMNVIFTKANADTSGRVINEKIEKFTNKEPEKYKLFDNLGQVRYLSALKHVDIMIGNSSSGLIEGPSFKIPVVNVGDRQKGRIKADNVIDCGYGYHEIKEAIKKGFSVDFKDKIKEVVNPYDKHEDGKTSCRIKNVLKEIEINEEFIKKSFYDINLSI